MPSGRWRAVFCVRSTGSAQDRIGRTFDTQTDARDWLAKQRDQKAQGQLTATRITLGEYLTQWLARRVPTVRDGTAAFYTKHVDRLHGSTLAALPLRKITRAGIETALPELGTPDQQRKALGTLRIVLNEAVRDGLIPSSPARTARRPKSQARRLPFWTEAEVGKILKAAEGAYLEAIFWLGLDSGMRPGEMLGLHWPEVDLTAGTVRVVQALEDVAGALQLKEPKTAKGRRTIRLNTGTVAKLTEHRASMVGKGRDVTTGPVFVGQRTAGLITHNVFYQRYYRPVIEAAGVPRHNPYGLRHTCATLLVSKGVSIRVVSDRLGHEDIATTLKHYAHCLPDSQEAAARATGEYMIPNSEILPNSG